MALVIYSNAILESMTPENLVYTEQELIEIFNDDYHTICSMRLSEIPNSWAVWALMENAPECEYNIIGSEIVDVDIESPLIIIHDSEMNPDWNLSDPMIQTNYSQFVMEVKRLIDKIAADIAKDDQEKIDSGEKESLIRLTSLGTTKDRKLIFAFDPDDQTEEFYDHHSFYTFSEKILEFLEKNRERNVKGSKSFVIFDDTKTMVVVSKDKVEGVVSKIVSTFEEYENYEKCQTLLSIKDEWLGTNVEKKKKRGRPKKE